MTTIAMSAEERFLRRMDADVMRFMAEIRREPPYPMTPAELEAYLAGFKEANSVWIAAMLIKDLM